MKNITEWKENDARKMTFAEFYKAMGYNTQTEAAADLGITQGSVSLHLRKERGITGPMRTLMMMKLEQARQQVA